MITSLGSQDSVREAEVRADNWLAALRAGREQLGDPGGVPSGASCVVAESGEVTILDPAARRRYVLTPPDEKALASQAPPPAAEITAAPPQAPAGAPAVALGSAPTEPAPAPAPVLADRPAPAPAPVLADRPAAAHARTDQEPASAAAQADDEPASARAGRALAYSPARADALQREYESARARASGLPPLGKSESERGNLRAVPSVGRPSGSSIPPPAKLASDRLPSARPRSARPAGSNATSGTPRLVPAFARDVDPSPRSPITYRERAYLIAPANQRDNLEDLLQAELLKVRGELASSPRGQLIHLAAFAKPFRGAPNELPVATLEWSDWRGNAVFVSHDADQTIATSSALPAPRASGSSPASATESDLRTLGSQVAPLPSAPGASTPQPAEPTDSPREAAAHTVEAHAEKAPSASPAASASAPAPLAAPAPPPSSAREAREDTGEVDGRLATAFEAVTDLYFLPTLVAGLEFISQLINRLVPCEALSVCLYDINTDEFRFVSVSGAGAQERRASAIPSQAGLFGVAKRSRQDTLLVQSVDDEPRYQPAIDGRSELEVCSLAYVPLRFNQQLLGMVQLINRGGDRGFTPADVAVLGYIASQLSEFLSTRRSLLG